MKILIDADGCPVVDITVKIAKENNIKCIIFCDTSHTFNYDEIETIVVSKGADSTDFEIVNMVQDGDIVITQDYGLATMCLAKKGIPINQDGMVYNDSNIDSLLFSRYISKKVRMSGGRVKGPKKRTEEQDKHFQLTLQRELNSRKN